MNKKYIIASKLTLGLFGGIGIGHIITIIVSAIFAGHDTFRVVVPSFLEMMGGNEILAATIAAILYGILGLVFAFGSIVWQQDKWSLLKRTVIYYFGTIIPMLLIGGFLRWFKIDFLSVLLFIGIFTVIFIIIWVITYLIIRKEIKEINSKLSQKQHN